MPETTPKNSNNAPPAKKKGSLGRGLGSLLGGSPADLSTPEPAKPTVAPAAAAAPTAPANVSTQAAVPAPVVEAPRPVIADEAQIWTIPIDRLVPNTQQPRQIFSPEALKDLTASIKEKGILQPIVARRLGERQFEIIAGERRWRSAQLAGLHEVPVILKKVSQQDSLELAIIENIQRENLNPMEEAEAYDNLMSDYSLTQQQVADKMGKDRSSIANILRLLVLPAEVKLMIRHNELSAGHAKVLLGLDQADKQIALAQKIIEEKLSVRATEKLVAKEKEDARAVPKPGTPANINVDVSRRLIDSLSGELQKLIGTKVSIDYANKKGKLQVHFYSDEQLSSIVEKMRRAWEK